MDWNSAVPGIVRWLPVSKWKLIGRVNACPRLWTCASVTVELLRTLPSPFDAGGDRRGELLNGRISGHDVYFTVGRLTRSLDTGRVGSGLRRELLTSVQPCSRRSFVSSSSRHLYYAGSTVGHVGSYGVTCSKTIRHRALKLFIHHNNDSSNNTTK